MTHYTAEAAMFKSLSEPVRLQILDLLADGELCACDLLENLTISQPTLSHHMKALIGSGWVTARKEANWVFYAIDSGALDRMLCTMQDVTAPKTGTAGRVIRRSRTCCPLARTHEELHHEA
ncbi:MAG: metalloregulator ArsR/SmtB family transcription factor [Eubacteriales bacterium]|nr:metalloregulator ArsR/SmtB family transcription factor [Eubacteriales bacterium]MDD4139691.1 metalloregulator ArsR/SmtB family transcription factor [Eubacteriales bacterium]NLO37022.1 winged helix-turn-helix transcriptional regulator [Clostridiaceae bacterium]